MLVGAGSFQVGRVASSRTRATVFKVRAVCGVPVLQGTADHKTVLLF